MMGLKGISAGAVLLVGLQEMAAARAGRGLYAGEETRPGRSDLAYMQHKYTPLDSRIIIITAAILLLLLSILFLNFFIRWALRRFFLSRSQKPINPNKGLSKRQVQALPFFIFSSSTPPPCAHPNIYPPLFPFLSHSDPLNPTSPKLDHIPTKFDISMHHPTHPSQSVPTYVIEVDNDPPVSLDVDQVISSNDSPATTEKDEALNNANSIIGSTKANVHTIHGEVKWDSPTFKGGNPIIDCTKAHEMASHGDDNANSHASCPICLVDFADGDTIRVLPTCQHYFHIGCIDLWLAKSSSCPACRANLLEATRTHPTLHIQVVTTSSP